MSNHRARPDHFISEQSALFSHPRLSQQRLDNQIEYLSSALSDLQSRAGLLAEENTQLHHLLNDRSETDQTHQPSTQQEREIPQKVTVPPIVVEGAPAVGLTESKPQGKKLVSTVFCITAYH